MADRINSRILGNCGITKPENLCTTDRPIAYVFVRLKSDILSSEDTYRASKMFTTSKLILSFG
jgi:hypothetical protein